MLFNSPIYIFLFLPIAVLVYYSLNSRRLVVAGKAWLVLTSLFFYGYWKPAYLLLIISSMLVNFAIGSALHRNRQADRGRHGQPNRKTVLIVGILFNLGLLGYFKYFDFMLENVNWITGSSFELLNLALPLAISFFTFQQIAYLADCYQQDTQEYDFLSYCLFVSFFPQLIAGPIVHHHQMMPQFSKLKNKVVRWNYLLAGVIIFSVGLFKKVVIADTFAVWANAGFDSTGDLSQLAAWGASLSYSFQLYYDFSGYSDMAIGAALLFNIHLPINFNSPYKAVSIQEFWRRWHMTLSRWLKDYLYIPLGGNRRGQLITYANVFVTFLLGGLWHGAGWTFVIWGAMHGFALTIHRFWNHLGYRMPRILAWCCTMMFINLTWVFFRAEDMGSAARIVKSMFSISDTGLSLEFMDQLSSALGYNLQNIFSISPAAAVVSELSLLASMVAMIAVLSTTNMMERKSKLLALEGLSLANILGYSFIAIVGLWFLFTSSSEVFLYFNF